MAWQYVRSEADLRKLHPGPDRMTGTPLPTVPQLVQELLAITLGNKRDPDNRAREIKLALIGRTAR